MKKAIVLSGVSGTGKTHTRLNDPELKDLPCLDIADICPFKGIRDDRFHVWAGASNW